MNTKTREEVLELLVETVKVWPGGIMSDSDPANCDEVLSWGKWMRLRSGEVIFNLSSPFECITEQDWREFGEMDEPPIRYSGTWLKDSNTHLNKPKANTNQEQIDEARAALGEFNDPDKTISECIKMLHFSFHTALTPMLWSKEISDAWHKDLPNTKQSFTNLKSAILDIKQPPHSP